MFCLVRFRSSGFGVKNKFVHLPLFSTKMWASRRVINGVVPMCSISKHGSSAEEGASPAEGEASL